MVWTCSSPCPQQEWRKPSTVPFLKNLLVIGVGTASVVPLQDTTEMGTGEGVDCLVCPSHNSKI